jgi:hypothetical protein
VYAVTNDKGKSRSERAGDNYYSGIRSTPYAIFVKLCDRLANVEYSKYSDSNMYSTYKREFDKFIEGLFGDKVPIQYKYMVNELKSILNLP